MLLVYPNYPVLPTTLNLSDTRASGPAPDPSMQISFRTDGRLVTTNSASIATQQSPYWYNTYANVDPNNYGAPYEIKIHTLSGGSPGGALVDTWLSLSTTRTWTCAIVDFGPATSNFSWQVDIRSAASSQVLATCTVNITLTLT